MECPQCKNSYVLNRDVRFYHCSDCKNIMCGKCSKEHYLKYPEHHCSNTDINGIVANPEYNNDNNNNNNLNNINNLNNSQLRNNNKRKINVKKYINKSQNPNLNQENIINNNLNNNNLNNSEINSEYNYNDRIYQNQNPNQNRDNINNNNNYLKNNNNYNYVDKDEENGAEFNYDDCFLCGIKQRENIQDKFFICRECDRLLCQNCKKKHDLINPNHNLVISYISGEIDNKDNIDNDPNHQICIHCQNRILNENNNNNLENMRYNLNNEENINYNNNAKNNNNSNIKLRKEKINQNIQSMQMLQNKQEELLLTRFLCHTVYTQSNTNLHFSVFQFYLMRILRFQAQKFR